MNSYPRFKKINQNSMLVTNDGPLGINTYRLNITQDQLDEYLDGKNAQDCFTFLDKDELEFIISGIPPGRWEESLHFNEMRMSRSNDYEL